MLQFVLTSKRRNPMASLSESLVEDLLDISRHGNGTKLLKLLENVILWQIQNLSQYGVCRSREQLNDLLM